VNERRRIMQNLRDVLFVCFLAQLLRFCLVVSSNRAKEDPNEIGGPKKTKRFITTYNINYFSTPNKGTIISVGSTCSAL
jgi:hypothetical protein